MGPYHAAVVIATSDGILIFRRRVDRPEEPTSMIWQCGVTVQIEPARLRSKLMEKVPYDGLYNTPVKFHIDYKFANGVKMICTSSEPETKAWRRTWNQNLKVMMDGYLLSSWWNAYRQ